MIKKILKIKNIGRYDMCSSDDDIALEKNTLIFGPNKTGKTTITSIFKSLKEGNPSYVLGRKSFDAKEEDEQECEILYTDKRKNIFTKELSDVDEKWLNKNIEIFDNDFINKNIFTGDKIEQNHKAELYKVLIDEDNIKKEEDIIAEEKTYRELLDEKEKIKFKIGLNYNLFIEIDDFKKIDDVDDKIKDNLTQQLQFENQKNLDDLKKSTKLSFNFNNFEEDLKKNINTTLESKIKNHISACWKVEDRDFNFLESGLRKIAIQNKCPFCGQSLDNAGGLINDMRSFFSSIYTETQTAIKSAIESFKRIDIEKEIAQFKAEGFCFKTVIDIDLLKKTYDDILVVLEEKQKDLSEEIDITKIENYKYFRNIIENLYKEINTLEIEATTIRDLKDEENLLKLNKERFSDEGRKNYKSFLTNKKQIKEKKEEIDKSNNALKEGMEKIFSQYSNDINTILQKSNANFKLSKLETISNRTMKEKHYCEYGFIFDSLYGVKIIDSEDVPQFKNTLSDSDKRILSFAFFIAKLTQDKFLKNKIIILDDPFTSLDKERRDFMLNILLDLDYKQIIILSHSRDFIKRCFLAFNKRIEENKNIKTLRLENDNLGKTHIVKLDIITDNDFLDGVDVYLQPLIKADISNIISEYDNIRKIIELVVEVKYSCLLDSNEKKLPMKYFANENCLSPVAKEIMENDYQENHHWGNNQPTPEELLGKRDIFIRDILPKI